MKIKSFVFFRLSGNYTSYFIYLGIMAPFWAMWLKSRGLSPSEIGLIIAVPHFMKIIMAPLISQIADRREEYWQPLLICTSISVFVSFFYVFMHDFWSMLLITVLANFTMPAIMPLLETITVHQSGKHNLNYGQVRSFGSLSFIVAAVILGWYLKNNTVENVIWAIYASLILFWVSVIFMPRGNKRLQSSPVSQNKTPIKSLLKDGGFIWFLCAVGLLQMSHGVYYSMGSIYWQDGGIDENVIGMLWAVGVVAEIAVFLFLGNYIKNKPVLAVFAVVGFFGALRWAIMAETYSLPILFIVQLLHGLTFGASHLAAINYLRQSVPQEFSGTAQSLYTAIPLGLGMGISTYIGSIIYEYEGDAAYHAMSLLCVGTLILCLFRSIFRFRRKN